jgi:hypothetical protein
MHKAFDAGSFSNNSTTDFRIRAYYFPGGGYKIKIVYFQVERDDLAQLKISI